MEWFGKELAGVCGFDIDTGGSYHTSSIKLVCQRHSDWMFPVWKPRAGPLLDHTKRCNYDSCFPSINILEILCEVGGASSVKLQLTRRG